MQQHARTGRREAPGGHHRLAPLARADTLGDAVHEQVDDLVLAEVARGEILIVTPELLAQFRHRRARQQQPAVIGAEGVLDIAHRQTARQHLHGQLLQRFGPALRMVADRGAERLVAAGNLRHGELDRTLRRLEPAGAAAVAIAATVLATPLVVIPPQRIPGLGFQSLLQDQSRGQPHQFRPTVRQRQPAFDQRRQGLAGAHGCGYSPGHGVLPGWRRRQPAKVGRSPPSRAEPQPNFQQL
jgi:hypothetical protein